MPGTGPGNCWSLGVTQYTSAWQAETGKEWPTEKHVEVLSTPEFKILSNCFLSSFTFLKKDLVILFFGSGGPLLLCAGFL